MHKWHIQVLLFTVALGLSQACTAGDSVYDASSGDSGGPSENGGSDRASEGAAESRVTGGRLENGGSDQVGDAGERSAVDDHPENGGVPGTGGNARTGGDAGTGALSTTGGLIQTGGDGGTGECLAGNQECVRDDACCSGVCLDGYCEADGPVACGMSGNPCVDDSWCCSGYVCIDDNCEFVGAGGNGGEAGNGGAGGSAGEAVAVDDYVDIWVGPPQEGCVPGLEPVAEFEEPFACTEFVRDETFDALVIDTMPHYPRNFVDVWKWTDDVTYVTVEENSNHWVFTYDGETWSTLEGLPEGFRPMRFRDMGERFCAGGFVINETYGIAEAKLYCRSGRAWFEQDVGFCFDECADFGSMDYRVQDMGSAGNTSVLVVTSGTRIDPAYYDKIYMKKRGGAWELQELPSSLGILMLEAVWVHSDCDAYVVGRFYGDRQIPTGVVLHYDGTGWSVLDTIGTVKYLNSVHGNGSEIFIGGSEDIYESDYVRSVFFSSTDLVAWDERDGSLFEAAGAAVQSLWTPRLGAVIVGQSQETTHEELACTFWNNAVIDVMSEGDDLVSSSVLQYAMSVSRIYMDANGSVLAGTTGEYTDDLGCAFLAGLYRATCE